MSDTRIRIPRLWYMYRTMLRHFPSLASHVGGTIYSTYRKTTKRGFRFLSKPQEAAQNHRSFVGQHYFDPWNFNMKVGQLETINAITGDKYLPNNIQTKMRTRWNLVTFMAFTGISLQGLSFTPNSQVLDALPWLQAYFCSEEGKNSGFILRGQS